MTKKSSFLYNFFANIVIFFPEEGGEKILIKIGNKKFDTFKGYFYYRKKSINERKKI